MSTTSEVRPIPEGIRRAASYQREQVAAVKRLIEAAEQDDCDHISFAICLRERLDNLRSFIATDRVMALADLASIIAGLDKWLLAHRGDAS